MQSHGKKVVKLWRNLGEWRFPSAIPLVYMTTVDGRGGTWCIQHSLLGSLECFVIIKYTKFGQLILRKIIKIVATRRQILRPKCAELPVGWGSIPDPAGVAYSTLPDP